jgi:hypothetical protein
MPSAIGFPSNPTVNQQYVVGTKTFKWDGTVWAILSTGTPGEGLTEAQVISITTPYIIGLS